MNYNVITCGRCSLCGGLVTTPAVWYGVTIPPKTCQSCGATEAPANLPVIQMTPKSNHWSRIKDYRNGPINPYGSSTLSPYTVDTSNGVHNQFGYKV